jgi:hypothetical protein
VTQQIWNNLFYLCFFTPNKKVLFHFWLHLVSAVVLAPRHSEQLHLLEWQLVEGSVSILLTNFSNCSHQICLPNAILVSSIGLNIILDEWHDCADNHFLRPIALSAILRVIVPACRMLFGWMSFYRRSFCWMLLSGLCIYYIERCSEFHLWVRHPIPLFLKWLLTWLSHTALIQCYKTFLRAEIYDFS